MKHIKLFEDFVNEAGPAPNDNDLEVVSTEFSTNVEDKNKDFDVFIKKKGTLAYLYVELKKVLAQQGALLPWLATLNNKEAKEIELFLTRMNNLAVSTNPGDKLLFAILSDHYKT
jgi:hypothetical protein